MPNPAIVWMPHDMMKTFADRSPRMPETPCLVLTPEVMRDLNHWRNSIAFGVEWPPYPWLTAALEAGKGIR